MAKNKQKVKCDLAKNWEKASFIPEAQEIIVYSDIHKMKIGDGETPIFALPFQEENKSTYIGSYLIS